MYLSQNNKNQLSLVEIDEDGALSKYNINLCEAKCPNCYKLCDAKHEQKNSKHKCQLGHQLIAFRDFQNEENNKTSFKLCNELDEYELILHNDQIYYWKDFKQINLDWDLEFSLLEKDQQQKMKQIYLGIWRKIGQKLSDIQSLQSIKSNSKTKGIRPNLQHYILCLDSSNSMKNEWPTLIQNVQDFLQYRMEKCSTDYVSIIVFSDFAEIRVNSQLVNPNLAVKRFMGLGTNFKMAFKQIFNLMEQRKQENHIFEQYQIIFFTDGVSNDPTEEIKNIMNNYGGRILKSWVIQYGEEIDIFQLKNITDNLRGELRIVYNNKDMVSVFRDIAMQD